MSRMEGQRAPQAASPLRGLLYLNKVGLCRTPLTAVKAARIRERTRYAESWRMINGALRYDKTLGLQKIQPIVLYKFDGSRSVEERSTYKTRGKKMLYNGKLLLTTVDTSQLKH